MKIAIVTLNYNGSKETLELLKSLKEQTDKDFEIIVVDNASEEADFINLQNSLIHIPTSFRFYRESSTKSGQVGYPQVQIVRNSENLGFSGGNNVGIRQTFKNSSDWVILLNNDTWVENGFMERLKAILSVKNGIIGIPLVENSIVAYCGKVQWLKPTLKHVYSIKNQVLRKNKNSIPNTKYLILNTYLYAIGGAIAIHKDVFGKIGLLDENYFLYFEDADFSVRAAKAGFNISIAKNLTANHHVSSSTKKLGSPLLLRYHYRNALYFNLKNGPWNIKLLVWPWSWIIAIKQLGKIAIKQDIEKSKAILAGVLDFYKNKMNKIKASTKAS